MIKELSVVEVIKAVYTTGSGTEKDPTRLVNGYWQKDGQPIALIDDFAAEKPSILTADWSKLVVLDTRSGEEIAVITDEQVTTAAEHIVVKLTPKA